MFSKSEKLMQAYWLSHEKSKRMKMSVWRLDLQFHCQVQGMAVGTEWTAAGQTQILDVIRCDLLLEHTWDVYLLWDVHGY